MGCCLPQKLFGWLVRLPKRTWIGCELFESKPTSDLDQSESWSMSSKEIGGLSQMLSEFGCKERPLIMQVPVSLIGMFSVVLHGELDFCVGHTQDPYFNVVMLTEFLRKRPILQIDCVVSLDSSSAFKKVGLFVCDLFPSGSFHVFRHCCSYSFHPMFFSVRTVFGT